MAWGAIWGGLQAAAEHPVIRTAALSAAGGIYNLINPDRAREIQMSVLDSTTQYRDDLARKARGTFTPAETQQISAGAEPQVNRVAGNVASRGLAYSGAGGQIVAQAQQAPFTRAQTQAAAELPTINQQLFGMGSALAGDASFFDDLAAISQSFAYLNDEDKDDPTNNNDEIDPTIEDAVDILSNALGIPTGEVRDMLRGDYR